MHKRAGDFKFKINRATKIQIESKDGDEREMEAYPGNPDVSTCFYFILILGWRTLLT